MTDLIWDTGRAVVELEGGTRRLSIISPERNEYIRMMMAMRFKVGWALALADEGSWEVAVMVHRGDERLGTYWKSVDGDIEEWEQYRAWDGDYYVYSHVPHEVVLGYIEEHRGKPVPEKVEEDG